MAHYGKIQQRRTRLAFLGVSPFLFVVVLVVIGRAQSTTQELTAGTWKVKPLVRLHEPAPETGGVFEEFGNHFWVDSGILVFWARFNRHSWALYSLEDGQVRLIGQNQKAIQMPDGAKYRYLERTWPRAAGTPLGAGHRLFYFQPAVGSVSGASSVYAWDGERVIRILGDGDKLTLSDGRETTVDAVSLTNFTNDGRGVIPVMTRKPKVFGWFLHDGTLVVLKVGHGPYKQALFRLTAAGVEKLLASNDPDPRSPKDKVRDIVSVYASDASHILVVAGGRPETRRLFTYKEGKWKTVLSNLKKLPGGRGYVDSGPSTLSYKSRRGGRQCATDLFYHGARSRTVNVFAADEQRRHSESRRHAEPRAPARARLKASPPEAFQ